MKAGRRRLEVAKEGWVANTLLHRAAGLSLLPLCAFVLALLAVPGSAATAQAQDRPLAPGDAVRVTIITDESVSGAYALDETGTVTLPHLGPRPATQIGAAELKRKLLDEYRRQFIEEAVTIVPLRRVRVLGAVKNPGLYHVDDTMSLADAIALAGGTTTEGKLQDVRIIRDGREIRSRLASEEATPVTMQSGDQIIVSQRGWFARNGIVVVGAVISSIGFILAQSL
jgi:protein involved in polysaccharide export with SLBB domain